MQTGSSRQFTPATSRISINTNSEAFTCIISLNLYKILEDGPPCFTGETARTQRADVTQLAPSKALNSGSLASALVLLLFSQVPWS